MPRKVCAVTWALAAAACCVSLLVTASSPEGPPFVVAIADGVYVHRGQHHSIQSQDNHDIANLAFVVGDRCVAVIDTGGSIATGQALRNAILGVTDRPICYVVNTHVHFDHLLGNAAFRDDHPVFVGHANLPGALAANEQFFLESFADGLGTPPSATNLIAPTQLVSDEAQLDLGGRTLTMIAHPPAHTNQDLTVFDERSATLFTGDLLFMERAPSLDGDLKGWLARLDALQSLPARQVVPGHGPARADWPAAAADLRRYLETLLTETRRAIADGKFMEDALKTVGNGERDRWMLFDDAHPRNVIRAFKELEWE